MKSLFICIISFIFFAQGTSAQESQKLQFVSKKIPRVLYGTSSFYANKFEGRQTANGEIFSQKKLTAACNVLPLGTWIRVTNLRNGRSVMLKQIIRLQARIQRVLDP